MKYYHEQNLKKEESLTSRWMKGAYINGDVLETIVNELDEYYEDYEEN